MRKGRADGKVRYNDGDREDMTAKEIAHWR